MATPAQEAFAEGFAALAEVHATAWQFGSATFSGVASRLQDTDPRMPGSSEHRQELRVRTSELPSSRPVRGDELVNGATYYRIERVSDNPTGTTVFTIIPA